MYKASSLFVSLFLASFTASAGGEMGCLDIVSYEPSVDDPTAVVVQTRPTPTVPDDTFTRPGTSEIIIANTSYDCDVVDSALSCTVDEGLFGTFHVQAREFGRVPCDEGLTVSIDTEQ